MEKLYTLKQIGELKDDEEVKKVWENAENKGCKELLESMVNGLGEEIKCSYGENLHLYKKDSKDNSQQEYRICYVRFIKESKIEIGKQLVRGNYLIYGEGKDNDGKEIQDILLKKLLSVLKEKKGIKNLNIDSEIMERKKLEYGINQFDKENIWDLINALRELVGKEPIEKDKGGKNMIDINKGINEIKEEIKSILKHNPQIVLTGAPGTGKTYMAKEICEELLKKQLNKENLTDEEKKKYIYFVQFHPSYDYTDFVEGLRPVKKGNEIGFERRDGIFMELCRQAKENPNKNYYLIIDEINRADLSKVFGELMYCLEYRGEEGRLKTQYNNLMEEDHPFKKGFYVPENVYIIATMNDIDRSVEAFDFALRRRFFWYEIKSNDVMGDVMKSMLGEKLEEELVNKLIESTKELNKAISDKGKDYGLNEHYHLGPAYFGKVNGLLEEEDKTKSIDEKIKIIKDKIWKYRVEPILREYVRGYDNVDKFIKDLKDVFEKANSGNSDNSGNNSSSDTNRNDNSSNTEGSNDKGE
ncbi:McrB family protein [Caloramator proteoclasticus]|uniref:AAA domain (Dynein-related subfamily) n=1 Tax=Caloramator proteoclasticus DSM 10124 TaxID=1121262 RepID=A0A1M4T5P8_9CLOT|nr:AAA family ATPase [Caloramator proteoclasticus]SHE39647.1 AAA domain (dynein-related subfamily) [Caloramator proteoclasticus DSM 10124]